MSEPIVSEPTMPEPTMPEPTMPGLSRLVGDPRLLRHWEGTPFVTTPAADFDDVLPVGSVDALLDAGLPMPNVRLFREGVALPAQRVARPRERRGRADLRLADAGRVRAEIRAGATLVVEEVQLFSPAVAALADAVARDSGYETDCTAFLTPARANGVGPHRDPVSVFLCQVHGAKRWRVWATPATGPDAAADPEAVARREPTLDVLLKAGDCLHIPRGHVHLGETLDEPSVHVAVSVRPPTWGEVLARAVEQVVRDDARWAEPVPPAFAVDRQGQLADRVAVLARRLAALSPVDLFAVPQPAAGATAPADTLQAALDRHDVAVRSGPTSRVT